MIILLEFNELCPHLLAQFMDDGLLPNFQRLYQSSTAYTTDAREEPPNLEPWIQWVTVHSGMEFQEHQVFHLGEGRKLSAKCLAELLSDAGVRVGVVGSMNVNYETLNGYYIPDPWDKEGVSQPDWLAPFYNTVSRQVQESSHQGGLSKRELIQFGTFMLRHGLSWGTINSGLKQLWDERKDAGLEWRRASLLEQIQYDLFRHLNRKIKPEFCTFFCNSTAHYQHYFWRNMQPEAFDVAPSEDDHESLESAIQFGYRRMDRVIGRFLKDYPQDTLILVSALSQKPWTDTTKCTFRPRDFHRLFEFAGIESSDIVVKPVMAEDFQLEFPDQKAAAEAAQKLSRLSFNEKTPLMKVEQNENDVFTGCAINEANAVKDAVCHADNKQQPFLELFHMVHSVRSGRHHPDGVLWIRDGVHRAIDSKVSLADIAPTILRRFNVPCPAYMKGQPLDAGINTHELAASLN